MNYNPASYYACEISIADILREYKASEPFRKQLDSGRYLYAENRLCLNHPKYINQARTTVMLTNYAREHATECCLVFLVTMIEGDAVYEPQRDGTHLALKTQPRASVPQYQHDPAQEKAHIEKIAETSKVVIDLAKELPTNFSEMLKKLMKMKGMKEEDLADEADLSTKTIQRLRNQNLKGVTLETIVQVCIGLHLHPVLSGYLLRAAGLRFVDIDLHNMYKFLLDSCYEYTVEECNDLLQSQGYGKLGREKKDKK